MATSLSVGTGRTLIMLTCARSKPKLYISKSNLEPLHAIPLSLPLSPSLPALPLPLSLHQGITSYSYQYTGEPVGRSEPYRPKSEMEGPSGMYLGTGRYNTGP